jgi:hypothetical protein
MVIDRYHRTVGQDGDFWYCVEMEKDLAKIERQGFRQRLVASLESTAMGTSPTKLTRQLNLAVPGDPVSSHAVRKWILGEAIPTQVRLQRLADLLGISAQWLRFGQSVQADRTYLPSQISPEIALIMEDVRRLNPPSRSLLDSLVKMMLSQQPE